MSNTELSTDFYGVGQKNGHGNPILDAILQALTWGGKVEGVFVHVATIDPSNMADGADTTEELTVPGVRIGDSVVGIVPGVDMDEITVTGYITADDTVELQFVNESGGAVNLGESDWTIVVYDLT